jgi:hypothetical protein
MTAPNTNAGVRTVQTVTGMSRNRCQWCECKYVDIYLSTNGGKLFPCFVGKQSTQ